METKEENQEKELNPSAGTIIERIVEKTKRQKVNWVDNVELIPPTDPPDGLTVSFLGELSKNNQVAVVQLSFPNWGITSCEVVENGNVGRINTEEESPCKPTYIRVYLSTPLGTEEFTGFDLDILPPSSPITEYKYQFRRKN